MAGAAAGNLEGKGGLGLSFFLFMLFIILVVPLANLFLLFSFFLSHSSFSLSLILSLHVCSSACLVPWLFVCLSLTDSRRSKSPINHPQISNALDDVYLEDVHVKAAAVLPGEESVVVVDLVAGGAVVVGHVATSTSGFPECIGGEQIMKEIYFNLC